MTELERLRVLLAEHKEAFGEIVKLWEASDAKSRTQEADTYGDHARLYDCFVFAEKALEGIPDHSMAWLEAVKRLITCVEALTEAGDQSTMEVAFSRVCDAYERVRAVS